MQEIKIGGLPVSGRKSAYVIRNRQGIVTAAQQALASKGSAVSIEEIATQSEVSVSTLYKHFANKDELVTVAFQNAMQTWEAWMQTQLAEVTDPIEQLVMPMRLFVRANKTHPVFAAMVAKNPSEAVSRLRSLGVTLTHNLRTLSKSGILNIDNIELRGELLMSVLVHLIQKVRTDLKFNQTAADEAIAVALGLLGIEDSKAKTLVRYPLPTTIQVT